jgi:hypothetical protein
MLFWGLPHAYRDMLVQHEGLTKIFRFLKRLPSPQDHRVGLFVLDNLTARMIFQNGDFEHEDLWSFGRTLGTTLAVLRGWTDSTKPKARCPEAALDWLGNEVLAGVYEVAFRVEAVEEMDDPPPLMWSDVDRAPDLLANLEKWIAWFRGSFLEKNADHGASFDSGLALHHLYDSHFGFKVDPADLAKLAPQAVKLAKAAHTFAIDALAENAINDFRKKRLQRVITHAGLPEASAAAAGVRDEQWIGSLPKILGAFDELMPSVLHKIVPPDLSGTDWEWMKQEVLKLSRAGCKYAGIRLHPGGQIAVSDMTGAAPPRALITDYDTEVFVAIDGSGHIQTIKKATWADVVSGAAFVNSQPASGGPD